MWVLVSSSYILSSNSTNRCHTMLLLVVHQTETKGKQDTCHGMEGIIKWLKATCIVCSAPTQRIMTMEYVSARARHLERVVQFKVNKTRALSNNSSSFDMPYTVHCLSSHAACTIQRQNEWNNRIHLYHKVVHCLKTCYYGISFSCIV